MACATCQKTSPEVNLKRCAKCSATSYCSRDCQKKDWKTHRKICGKPSGTPGATPASNASTSHSSSAKGLDGLVANPFTRLDNGTWLHDRPENDVYQLLIDAYRMHAMDMYVVEGYAEKDSIYSGAPNGLVGFRTFLDHVEAKNGLLPSWWSNEKRAACETRGMDPSQWCNLRCAVEKSSIIEHYGDPRFPMQLRMFAEAIYGRAPGGGDGTRLRKTMAMMERGESSYHLSTVDLTTGNTSEFR